MRTCICFAMSMWLPFTPASHALTALAAPSRSDEKLTPVRDPNADAAKALGRDLADAKRLTKYHLDRYVNSNAEVRRLLFSMSPQALGFSDANRVAFVKMVMQHEGKNSLSEDWLDPALSDEDTAIVLAKLRAVPGSSRVYCLQSLWRAKDKARVADVVAEYLHDPDREVRITAVRALGFLGGRKHVPAILETYKREATKPYDTWFAESLSQLGEVDTTLRCIRSSMASQNWNLRYVAADSLKHVQSPRVVALAMELLETEFGQTMEEHALHSLGDRVFISLCQTLEKNTKQKHGSDVLAWQRWWNDHCKDFGGQPVRVNADDLARTQEAYWKLFPFRKTRID